MATEIIPIQNISGSVFKRQDFRNLILDSPNDGVDLLPPGETGEESKDSSGVGLMEILIPVAIVVVLLVVVIAAAITRRYRNNFHPKVNGQCKTNLDNNNKNLRSIEEGLPACEESVPLKNRNIYTSSSTSTVSPTTPIGASNGATVNMRIASEAQNTDILKSNRTDICGKIQSEQNPSTTFGESSQPDSVHIQCDVLHESSLEIFSENTKSLEQEDTKDIFTEDVIPKRPKTLVMMVAGDNQETRSKGFFCSEQTWTPDADIIYEDTGSPDNSCDLRKEQQDRLCPLMGKGRFKMKPKGLLERRGSNVALTISLKNEEKSSSSPPPSSRSPKPLVYLRTATAKLDPVQLHIKASDTARLQQEFWEVPMNHPSEKHFSIPGYGTKNRYRSILPNPHSRVSLPAVLGGDPLSAYINANYVRGYSSLSESAGRRVSEGSKENDERRMSIKRKAAFIATQGPMANTIVDFWKMVWRENSSAIVMITKLKERKEKCAEYMPTACSETHTYEQFEIKVRNVRNADHYTVRTLEVRNSEETDEVRIITHYWYAEWLDHETPDKLRSLLTLVQEVDVRCPDVPNAEHGPVIVHCSAGIGRTGCFIAINIGCRQLRFEGKVDPLRIICQLRMDRGGMIQTWEQYQYVHVALSRYARILAGENVNTPLTGSSIITPDSRGSSKLTTPSSGSSEFKSPYNSNKIFSPKGFSKSALTTVVENSDKDSAKSSDNEASTLSPRHDTVPVVKSRFSFSCADSLTLTSNKSHGSATNGTNSSTDENINGISSARLSRKLSDTLSPIRDEDWLVNGHCEVENGNKTCTNNKDTATKVSTIEDGRCPNDSEVENASLKETVEVPCQGNGLDNCDELEKAVTMLDSSHVPTTSGDNTKPQNPSIFMFPTPEK